VQVARERRPVRARTATAEERSRLWPKVVETYGGYAGYQERTSREIPLVILERRSG
jgi:deazaflavin-dependent oxidoreductase (nitroreductase family)